MRDRKQILNFRNSQSRKNRVFYSVRVKMLLATLFGVEHPQSSNNNNSNNTSSKTQSAHSCLANSHLRLCTPRRSGEIERERERAHELSRNSTMLSFEAMSRVAILWRLGIKFQKELI